MGAIDEHADFCLGQLFFAVDQVGGAILARIGVEPEESREAVLLEKVGVEREGGGDATDVVTGP